LDRSVLGVRTDETNTIEPVIRGRRTWLAESSDRAEVTIAAHYSAAATSTALGAVVNGFRVDALR
jgi:hypothetical protein